MRKQTILKLSKSTLRTLTPREASRVGGAALPVKGTVITCVTCVTQLGCDFK